MPGAEKIQDSNEKSQTIEKPNPFQVDAEPEEIIPISPEEDALQVTETLRDMVVGIVVCTVVMAAAGSLLAGLFGTVWYRVMFGVLLGGVVAQLMLRHMYGSIDRMLDMDAESASKYSKRSASIRMLMAAAALAAAAFLPKVFSVFGVLIGALSLKFSAYLQPLTHKVIKSINKGR